MSSGVGLGGSLNVDAGSGCSPVQRLEKVLMNVTTARRSLAESSCHVGIAVQRTPRVTVAYRSPSVGSDPDGTVRNLKTLSVKLRGRGERNVAATPLPSPALP